MASRWRQLQHPMSPLVTNITLVLLRFSSSLEVSHIDLVFGVLRTLRINWTSKVVFWGSLSARMWSCKVLMFNDAPLVAHHAESEDHWNVQGLGRLLLMGMKVDFFHRLGTRTVLQGPS